MADPKRAPTTDASKLLDDKEMRDGKDDTTFGDEIRKEQGQQQPPPSSITQPNEGTMGDDFRDFLKPGDLASGQSEDDLTEKQKDALIDRQVDFLSQQKDQAEAADVASQPAIEPEGEPSEQSDDKQGEVIQLLTDISGFMEAMSINIAEMAANAAESGDNSVRLGSK